MSETTPDDYQASDGVDDALVDQCPHCERSLHPDIYHGLVYKSDGTEYEHIMDTDAIDRPFFCPDCFKELDANRKANQHKTLGEYNE